LDRNETRPGRDLKQRQARFAGSPNHIVNQITRGGNATQSLIERLQIAQ
jgi:hypothetical protein